MKLKLLQKKSPKSSKSSASVVVGASGLRRFRWSSLPHFSKKTISATGLLLLAAVIVVVVLLIRTQTSPKFGSVKQLPPTPVVAANTSKQATQKQLVNYYQQQIDATTGATQAQPYYHLGQVYLSQGDLNDALAATLKAYNIQPYDLRTIETLGDIYSKLGQTQKAISYYQQDISLFKKSALAQQPGSDQQVELYQQKIKDLEGGKQ